MYQTSQSVGSAQEETIQKLKTQLWYSRTKSSAVRSSHAELFRYEPAEAEDLGAAGSRLLLGFDSQVQTENG